MTESMPPSPEQIRQLNRRLNEQVLERATADLQWKQRYLDDPGAAIAEFPEAQRLREMYEGGATPAAAAPAEAMPTPPEEEYRQLQRSLWDKVLDKAASDPAWKQRLLDDPEAASREADFPEMQQLEQLDEVRGHYPSTPGEGSPMGHGCQAYCRHHSLWVDWICW